MVTINGEPARLADVTLDRRTWLRLSAKDLKTIAAIRQTARQRAKGEGER